MKKFRIKLYVDGNGRSTFEIEEKRFGLFWIKTGQSYREHEEATGWTQSNALDAAIESVKNMELSETPIVVYETGKDCV